MKWSCARSTPTVISEIARHCQVVASGVGGRPVAVGVISAAVNLLSGVGLLAAGVLALVGRSEYVAWKRRSKRR